MSILNADRQIEVIQQGVEEIIPLEELKQKLDGLTISAVGYYTSPQQNEARKLGSNFEVIGPDYGVTIYPQYLNNRATTIYGGSNEVQKNIMAKFVLGL